MTIPTLFREVAETIPALTVRSRPKGLPMARTQSPGSSFSDSPQVAASGTEPLTFTTARSVLGSEPDEVAQHLGPTHSDRDQVGPSDHVLVGDDEAPGPVDHHARALGHPAPFLAEGLGPDEHHRRRDRLAGQPEQLRGPGQSPALVELLQGLGRGSGPARLICVPDLVEHVRHAVDHRREQAEEDQDPEETPCGPGASTASAGGPPRGRRCPAVRSTSCGKLPGSGSHAGR